ncbi:hypothetical protein BBJ28_00019052, partial [Nothophytophthora sp. Chile5]
CLHVFHDRRKRENADSNSSLQRRVAQRLLVSADVGDAHEALHAAIERQQQRFQEQHACVAALSRLQLGTEQVAHFQALWGAYSNGASELIANNRTSRLHNQLKKLLGKVSRKTPAEDRLALVQTRLPRLMARAERAIGDQRRQLAEQRELPSRHQWVPSVLWRLYDDVAAAVASKPEMEPMKTAMHEVMAALRDVNPFFFLQVLYQPPPPHLETESTYWKVRASKELSAITDCMTPYFRYLNCRAYALMNDTDTRVRIHHGWNKLRVTLTFVRRAARLFHFVMLHLYSVAMGRALPHANASVIAEKASSASLGVDAALLSRLEISHTASEFDNLSKETYEWTPELLVYLDEWRRHAKGKDHEDTTVFGFDQEEQVQHFLPLFSFEEPSRRRGRRQRKWDKHDVLAEIGGHFQDADRAWRASRLGSPEFRSMRIEAVGALETQIKGSLAAVVDLVYKMMLARWMERRRRPNAWWRSLNFRERLTPPSSPPTPLTDEEEELQGESAHLNVEDDVLTAVGDDQEAAHDDVRSSGRRPPPAKGFRPPTSVTLPSRSAVAKSPQVNEACDNVRSPLVPLTPRRPARDYPILLREVCAWTDEEIDDYERETERILEARAALLTLRGQLTFPKAGMETATNAEARPAFGEPLSNDWLQVTSHLSSLCRTAVAFAEEIAMHGAANALIQRPGLRVGPKKIVAAAGDHGTCSKASTSDSTVLLQLQDLVRGSQRNVAQMLALYDGHRSPEWYHRILSVGRASAQLLRVISEDGLRRLEVTKTDDDDGADDVGTVTLRV